MQQTVYRDDLDHIQLGRAPRSQVEYDYGMEPETDVDYEDDLAECGGAGWVREQLERSNDWAWCRVTVTARWDGLEGVYHLGCVSKGGLLDFLNDGTYDDMCARAYADLQKQADRRYKVLSL